MRGPIELGDAVFATDRDDTIRGRIEDRAKMIRGSLAALTVTSNNGPEIGKYQRIGNTIVQSKSSPRWVNCA